MKHSFSSSGFMEAVAFMLDLPESSVQIDAVLDMRLPPETGVGAYYSRYPEYYGNNMTQWMIDWNRRANGVLNAATWRRAALALLTQRPYRLTSNEGLFGVRVLASVFVSPVEVQLTQYRLQNLDRLRVAPGGWAEIRSRLQQAERDEMNRAYCLELTNATTGAWRNVSSAGNCYLYVTADEYALVAAAAADGKRVEAAQNLTRSLLTFSLIETDYVGERALYPENGTSTLGTAIGPMITFASKLWQSMPFTWLDANDTSMDDGYLPMVDVRQPAALRLVRSVRGSPTQPVYANREFPQQPLIRVVDRHERVVLNYPFDIRVVVTATVRDKSGAQFTTPMRGAVQDYVDLTGHIVYRDLSVTFNYSVVYLTFTARINDALTGAGRVLNVTSEEFEVFPIPPEEIIIIPRVPLDPAIVGGLVAASLAILVAVVWLVLRSTHKGMASAKVKPDVVATKVEQRKPTTTAPRWVQKLILRLAGSSVPPTSSRRLPSVAQVAVQPRRPVKLPLPYYDMLTPTIVTDESDVGPTAQKPIAGGLAATASPADAASGHHHSGQSDATLTQTQDRHVTPAQQSNAAAHKAPALVQLKSVLEGLE